MQENYTLLVESLNNLGLPYHKQLLLFPNYVDVVDEIITDFDNAFPLVAQLMDEKKISYSSVRLILHCYNLINLNLSVDERMSNENFKSADYWQLVRDYANNALKDIALNTQ